jgi:signal transduction histidine kinase
MVARIERLKSKRETEVQPDAGPELAMPEAKARPTTDPACFAGNDASGQIGWPKARRAPDRAQPARGRWRTARTGAGLHRPVAVPRYAVVLPTPALEGEWRLSGIPAFSPTDGRFRVTADARREGVEAELEPAAPQAAVADAEALRETIHEIKTPLNAIIGFAEIIDGQYLGPAHRNYRHRAAEIVAQARMLLAAIEDLDFAARLQGRAAGEAAATDLADVLRRWPRSWATVRSRAMSGCASSPHSAPCVAALSRNWRGGCSAACSARRSKQRPTGSRSR